jgi:acetyl esterase/lipase
MRQDHSGIDNVWEPGDTAVAAPFDACVYCEPPCDARRNEIVREIVMRSDMIRSLALSILFAVAASPAPAADNPTTRPTGRAQLTLAEARKAFKTTLTERIATNDPLPAPPPKLFRLVKYDAPVGKLSAYLTPDAGDAKKRPAIVWITGGDCNSTGDVWTPAPEENDQTAAAYRQAGIVMMFPSLRGGNGNPGQKEGFYGEVDDVLAAAAFLATQPHVDPKRIYLGGHSTGGSLALLVAEYSDRFRAVFSFGPVQDVCTYGRGTVALPFDTGDPRERFIRAPGRWLHGIKSPTFVFEGDQRPSNIAAVVLMGQSPTASPAGHFFTVKGKSHFDVLAPMNALIAAKINRDAGTGASNISFAANELQGLTPVARPVAKPAATTTTTPPHEQHTDAVGVATDPGPAPQPAQGLLGTAEGNRGSYSFPASKRMVGIRYDLAKRGDASVLRRVSAFAAGSTLPLRDTEKIVQARDGYMVYGLVVDADTTQVNAMRVVFVRVDGNKLVPTDTYMSDWLGTRRTDKPLILGADGRRVKGIQFYEGDDRLNGLGLLFDK